ncbi:MAG TPA: FGGY family carbohydrate kinase, partial [Actinomycetota bacterium]|nr:FGGY family carbohydrate kinase [Actinomycetota bacterium]
VLGLDLGTGSIKAVAFSGDRLEVLASASVPLTILAPRAGWAESAPEEWLEAAGQAVRRCLSKCGDPPVAGVGLSGQMHGVGLCRAEGAPTRNAVLWADTRSSSEAEKLRRAPPELQARLANPAVTGMAGPTLAWLVKHEPESIRSADWALQPKDWLRMILTGEAATEPSDASATLLWDLPADRWCEDVFDLLDVPLRLAPPDLQSAAVAGTSVDPQPVLAPGIPVVCGGADTACALFGAEALAPGTAQISVGTGAQVVVALESPEADRSARTHLYRSVLPGSWYGMGAVQNAGLAFERAWRWLAVSWDQAYGLAEQAPPGAAGLTFLPHLSGERTPYVDSGLRGGWIGLGLEHTRAHLVRSVLEGVAFAIRDAVEALRSAGRQISRARLVGGGSLHPLWRQLLADVLQLPLTVVTRHDAAARGAARLACLGLGIEVEIAGDQVEETVRPSEPGTYEDAYARFLARVPVRALP